MKTATRVITWLGACAVLSGCGGSQAPAEAPSAEATPETATEEPTDGPKPCRAESFEFSEVEAACADGGLDAAKDLMKDYVKQAKAAGNKLKCSSCHDSTKTYTLKENGVADLRALLDG